MPKKLYRFDGIDYDYDTVENYAADIAEIKRVRGADVAAFTIKDLAAGNVWFENHLRGRINLPPIEDKERYEMGNEPPEPDIGRKNDAGKPPLHLIPPEFLYAVAEILDFGAKKYAPRNWEKGLDWSRCYRAAIGHLFDWFARKGPDPETGKSHLWHAACCVMFLVCYEIRQTGTDDRP